MFEIQAKVSNCKLVIRAVEPKLLTAPMQHLKTLVLLKPNSGSAQLPRYLEGDYMRFTQVLINIIKNSLKFSANGTINVFMAYDPAA